MLMGTGFLVRESHRTGANVSPRNIRQTGTCLKGFARSHNSRFTAHSSLVPMCLEAVTAAAAAVEALAVRSMMIMMFSVLWRLHGKRVVSTSFMHALELMKKRVPFSRTFQKHATDTTIMHHFEVGCWCFRGCFEGGHEDGSILAKSSEKQQAVAEVVGIEGREVIL